MTVQTTNRIEIYQGNSSATAFPFNFEIPTGTLSVAIQDWTTKEVLEVLAPGDYIVTGLDNPGGGVVTYEPTDGPLTAAYGIIILRTVPFTQDLDISPYGGFTPTVVEKQLDRIVMQIQQLNELQSRSIIVNPGATPPDVNMIAAAEGYAESAAASAAAAAESAASIGVVGRSDYADIPTFEATNIPAVVERPRVNEDRAFAGYEVTDAPATVEGQPTLPSNVFLRHKRKTVDGRWWEPKGLELTPEMFVHSTDGDNDSLSMARMTNSAELWGINVIMLKPGKQYLLDDQVVVKPGQRWFCDGAKLTMRSNPEGRGGFIRTQGSGSNIDANFIYRNDIVIYGMWADIAPGVKGVNCFGTTVSDRITFVDCVATGAKWGNPSDPIKKGGRGFSSHPKSRYVKHINCRAYQCSVGFHASDKADYNPIYDPVDNPNGTPVLEAPAGLTATPGNPTIFTAAGHRVQTGAKWFGQRFSGTWVGINGVEWTATRIDANTFSIPFNSSGLTWNNAGRLSKADTGVMRTFELLYEGCVAEECGHAGIIFEQVIDSMNLDIAKNWRFTGRLINCGSEYPTEQGIIILSGTPGCHIDVDVYNDSTHAVGSVLRGAAPLGEVKVRGKVHTCVNMINHNRALPGSVNLDEGTAEHPQGTGRAIEYKFAMEFNTVSGDLITTSSVQASQTDNQNFTWRSRYDIEYSVVSLGGSVINTLAKHATNDFRIKNMATGAILQIGPYTFESLATFGAGIAVTGDSTIAGNWAVTGSITATQNMVATNALIGASIRTAPVAVAALPSAASAGAGSRRLVNDANATTFNSTVAGGGANIVPVFSDGTNWKIG